MTRNIELGVKKFHIIAVGSKVRGLAVEVVYDLCLATLNFCLFLSSSPDSNGSKS